MDTARIEESRWKTKIENMMEEKGKEVDSWLFENGIPSSKKSEIMAKVEKQLKEKKDVDVNNILSIISPKLQKEIKSCMPLSRVEKVRINSSN